MHAKRTSLWSSGEKLAGGWRNIRWILYTIWILPCFFYHVTWIHERMQVVIMNQIVGTHDIIVIFAKSIPCFSGICKKQSLLNLDWNRPKAHGTNLQKYTIWLLARHWQSSCLWNGKTWIAASLLGRAAEIEEVCLRWIIAIWWCFSSYLDDI